LASVSDTLSDSISAFVFCFSLGGSNVGFAFGYRIVFGLSLVTNFGFIFCFGFDTSSCSSFSSAFAVRFVFEAIWDLCLGLFAQGELSWSTPSAGYYAAVLL